MNIFSNNSIHQTLDDKLIGIVKFYDSDKDFGFIYTNARGSNQSERIKDVIFSYYFNSHSLSDSSQPVSDGDWVTFRIGEDNLGRQRAKQVKKLFYNQKELRIALNYRGDFARISGPDPKTYEKYDFAVLPYFLDHFDTDDNTFQIACDTIIDCVRNSPAGTLAEFARDDKTCSLIFQIFRGAAVDEHSVNQDDYKEFLEIFAGVALEHGGIDFLDELSVYGDLTEFLNPVSSLLEREALIHTEKVVDWLEKHSEIIPELQVGDSIGALALRTVLALVTADARWVKDTELRWDQIVSTVSGKISSDLSGVFLSFYFSDRDPEFMAAHPLTCKLSEGALEELEIKAENAEGKQASSLRLLLADYYSRWDLQKTGQLIECGLRIFSWIAPNLAELANRTALQDPELLAAFIKTCLKASAALQEVFPQSVTLSDETLITIFVETKDQSWLERTREPYATARWMSERSKDFIFAFVNAFGPLIDKDSDEYFPALGAECLVSALEGRKDDAIWQALEFFPEKLKGEVVGHFAGTKVYELYVKERWDRLRANLAYTVFTLRCDGDEIKEFAFRSAGHTSFYEDPGQLMQLVRALGGAPLIAGYRIKQRALPLLREKGVNPGGFVWDTLEMEILLDPCRYAYSLKNAENAAKSAELTDSLFLSQLCRLALDDALCQRLKDFLPEDISSLLAQLKDPLFKNYLEEQKAAAAELFFNEVDDIGQKQRSKLEAIEKQTGKDPVLIIAPRRLWAKIAQYLPVSFADPQKSRDYLPLSREKIAASPLPDSYQQAVLERFVSLCKTPIPANLAEYLRSTYFDEKTLAPYLDEEKGELIICADPQSILRESALLSQFGSVFEVGCELENRLNYFTLPGRLNADDFWQAQSKIPLRLGGSAFAVVTPQERESPLFAKVPKEACNVWIERDREGGYLVNYNFDVNKGLRALLGKKAGSRMIGWKSGAKGGKGVKLVYRKKARQGVSSQALRVGAASRYRSVYRAFQFALVAAIAQMQSLPIIYVLNDAAETWQAGLLARDLGFNVPSEGTLSQKLEYLSGRSRALMAVCKEQFLEIAQRRLDTAFCYVFDEMDVERHMLMWRDSDRATEFLDDSAEKRSQADPGSDDAYQAVLEKLWPEYEHYCALIKETNSLSEMYLIDPFLDEYHTLSGKWGAEALGLVPEWPKLKDGAGGFEAAVRAAREFFPDYVSSESPHGSQPVQTAMDVILATLVRTKEHQDYQWSAAQLKILPKILGKEENCLVSLPTGGGKSVLFQGPALYNAAYTNRLSIVVSPLRALMQDQVRELNDKGFITNVEYLSGDRSYQETKAIYRRICGGEIALLYVTPERFRSRMFIKSLKARMERDGGLEYMIFDEAHCISQWGSEFRPEYLHVLAKCRELQKDLGGGMSIEMFSATVTDMIWSQINAQVPVIRLGQDEEQQTYSPVRGHIGIQFVRVENSLDARIGWLVNFIKSRKIDFQKSRMLVFCKMRSQCEDAAARLASALAGANILDEDTAEDRVRFFHAGMDAEDREETYERFKSEDDPIYILCATKAFGMGMDIPNIHYIVHLSPPSVLEDYLQEVGRAGRNKKMYEDAGFGEDARLPAVCLWSDEDINKAREQLMQSGLSWAQLEQVRGAILDYIKKIRSLNQTKDRAVVIPGTLWSAENDNSGTSFRLAEYWLERLGRIKLGYMKAAHIVVQMYPQSDGGEGAPVPERLKTALQKLPERERKVYKQVAAIAQEQHTQTLQISLSDLSYKLSLSFDSLVSSLVKISKTGALAIIPDSACVIAKTRTDEVAYFEDLSDPARERTALAFHVIADAALNLLSSLGKERERVFSKSQLREFVDTAPLNDLIKTVKKDDGKGGVKDVYYMLWHSEEGGRDANQGLSKVSSYKKDLFGKRVLQIFSLLSITPGVRCRSYADYAKGERLYSVRVTGDGWAAFLKEFKDDCLRLLRLVYKEQTQQSIRFDWNRIMLELGLEDKGFPYFKNLVYFLNGMAYINCGSLLPSGIEVYTTGKSEQEVLDPPQSDEDSEVQRDFLEAEEIRELRLDVMDVATRLIRSDKDFQELISAYFSCKDAADFIGLLQKYYPEEQHRKFWDSLRKTAITNAEAQMKDNKEQWAIYQAPSDQNINVEAGPGSGKTHVLTMRCAKLIYHEHVAPSKILVLAYNRAVVVELRSRLERLFLQLGLTRSACRLHVYTFHGLAKRALKDQLKELELKEWEGKLLELVKDRFQDFRKIFPDLQYVLIDEFQDITQTRLDFIFELSRKYPKISFFTIGDKNQSIYGFEKEESTDPNYYYKQLYEVLKPERMTMFVNYRSYPKILDAAAGLLPEGEEIPKPCRKNRDEEPSDIKYAWIPDVRRNWAQDLKPILERFLDRFKKGEINDVAVFFRTNNEVYRGLYEIRKFNLPGVRIRIQGASECELYRKREIWQVIRLIEERADEEIRLNSRETENELRSEIAMLIEKKQGVWDVFSLDFAYTLALDYLESVASDENSHTMGEMAEAMKEALLEDNSQLYRIYDRFKEKRILTQRQMNVVLTTMHKVKGLEFDAVIVTPSSASLPLSADGYIDMSSPLSAKEREDIDEERRLLYVAYTRAKKFLVMYKGAREKAVIDGHRYAGADPDLGFREKEPKIKNYNIGFFANSESNYRNLQKIFDTVQQNAPVTVQVDRSGRYPSYDLWCNGIRVGQLSSSSSIAQEMKSKDCASLEGFFVSDVYYWGYEDTVKTDEKNGTNWAGRWCREAKEQGYIFIVGIAGYGHPVAASPRPVSYGSYGNRYGMH